MDKTALGKYPTREQTMSNNWGVQTTMKAAYDLRQGEAKSTDPARLPPSSSVARFHLPDGNAVAPGPKRDLSPPPVYRPSNSVPVVPVAAKMATASRVPSPPLQRKAVPAQFPPTRCPPPPVYRPNLAPPSVQRLPIAPPRYVAPPPPAIRQFSTNPVSVGARPVPATAQLSPAPAKTSGASGGKSVLQLLPGFNQGRPARFDARRNQPRDLRQLGRQEDRRQRAQARLQDRLHHNSAEEQLRRAQNIAAQREAAERERRQRAERDRERRAAQAEEMRRQTALRWSNSEPSCWPSRSPEDIQRQLDLKRAQEVRPEKTDDPGLPVRQLAAVAKFLATTTQLDSPRAQRRR